MIVTLTPNTAIDHTLVVPEFSPNKTIRASQRVVGMGGKAADVSYILGKMGHPGLALGFAAGESGKKMEVMLQERGVITDFVWTEGETRVNIIVVSDDGANQTTFTVPTLVVKPEHLPTLKIKFNHAIQQADCLVLGGTLPTGVPDDFYVSLIHEARQRSIPVLLDASGPAFRLGLSAGPNMIKPNRAELSELCGSPVHTLKEITLAARQIQKQYGCDLVVSLGERGGLAFIGENCWRIRPFHCQIRSTAGAGDGILSGLALAYAQRSPLETGLRIGFALANAILMTPATADFNLEDYRSILPKIRLHNIKPADSQ